MTKIVIFTLTEILSLFQPCIDFCHVENYN